MLRAKESVGCLMLIYKELEKCQCLMKPMIVGEFLWNALE